MRIRPRLTRTVSAVTAGAAHVAELTSPQLGDAVHDGTAVALLPVGAVEPHGPHAPLGTDTLISVAVCERAATILSGDSATVRALVLPAVAYGVTRFSESFPGSVSLSATTLRALVVDICESLEAQGIALRVIVNSHFEPAHVAALREAAAQTGATLFDVTRRHVARRLTDEFSSGSAHAGRYETSIVLAVQPGLVDEARMRLLPALQVDMPAAMASGLADFHAMGMHDAYCGAPADATAEEGEQTLSTLSEMVVELVRERLGDD
jgi:creatinine amidohydrolase